MCSGWALERLSICAYGVKYDVIHALSWKKVWFCYATPWQKVCVDKTVEQMLTYLTGEQLRERTNNKNREVGLDVSSINFWVSFGSTRILWYKGFWPWPSGYSQPGVDCIPKVGKMLHNKREWKEEAIQRTSTWSRKWYVHTICFFFNHGTMGRECTTFYKRLFEMVHNISISWVTNSLRTKNSFYLRSTIRCICGSR